MDHRPKKNPKTIKPLGKKIEENLCGLGLGKDFLYARPKARSLEEKKNWEIRVQILKKIVLWVTLLRWW